MLGNSSRPLRVLIIGQTPPPFGGQARMRQALLDHPMPGIERRHVRLAYSREMTDIGKVTFGKVLHLFGTVVRVLWAITTFRPDVVYYPPGGPNRAPVIRDVLTLLAIRPFCRRLVFHFHAGGLADVWRRGFRSRIAAALFRRAFFGADAAIVLAESNRPDGEVLEARLVFVVPNGIPDEAGRFAREPREVPGVLFVGVHLESKGVVVLAEACTHLWDEGLDFTLTMVGDRPEGVEERIRAAVGRHADRLRLCGVLLGDDKWREFAMADVFCFPTFFEAEAMPVVALEGMMFGLPIVATRWRGLPEVVEDGVTGYLVEPRDAQALADRLRTLLLDLKRRAEMGKAARQRFEQRYGIDGHVERMREVFADVVF